MADVRLCALADVPAEGILRIELPGRKPVALAMIEGALHAFDDTCPHADESLSKGWIEDGRVVCAVHFAEFEAGTGVAHNAPIGCGRLQFHPVEIRDGTVFAALDA